MVAAFDDLRLLRIKGIQIKFVPLVFITTEPMSDWLYKFRKRQATQEVTAALMRASYEGLIE
jgi:hypothetical protein